MRVDPLSDLEFFVQLAHAGSLAAAAREQGVAPSTVTKRLAGLELRLNVRLINRTTRRMSLTDEGEAFLREGSRVLVDLKELEQRLAGATLSPRGLLRVNATLGFGREHIAPLVSQFSQRYPEVEVLLHLSDRPLNLIEQGFDVAVRIGELPDQRLTARKIANNERILCAAPAYLARAGSPARPADLQAHRCLMIRENDDTVGVWRLTHDARQESVKLRSPLSTNDGAVALGWALEGQGILMRSEWDAARYLRSGRLVRVLPEWSAPRADIVAVFPTKQHLSARTRAFVDHLVERFNDFVF